MAGRRGGGGVAGLLSDLGRVLCSLGDVAAARALLVESAIELRAVGSQGLIAWNTLDDLACLAAAEGKPERALRLSGAAEALREQIGMQLPPPERAQLDRLLASARQALSEEAQAVARAAGRAMALEQAIREASDEEPAGQAGRVGGIRS